MKDKKIHYLVYKITNLQNNRYYIGQHQTFDINDGYRGSGKELNEDYHQLGIKSDPFSSGLFKKEILFDFDTFEEMNSKEIELVDQKCVEDPLSYNKKLGGGGTDIKFLVRATNQVQFDFECFGQNLYLSTLDALQPLEQRFLKILTFHLLRKLKFFFKWNLNAFYNAPAVYQQFIKSKNPNLYDSLIYKNIAMFNGCGLDSKVLKHIAGAYPQTNKAIPYGPILENLEAMGLISIRQQGSMIVKKMRHHYSNCYVVSREIIESCISDQNTMKKVMDPNSSFYSKSERRIIYNQLLKKSKTKDESEKETELEKKEMAQIDSLIAEIKDIQIKDIQAAKFNQIPKNPQ